PTRVLDVSGEGPDIILYETESESAHYACLSHCWGASQIIQTTEESLESFKERIIISELSRTFQDAVQIVRQLGIKYLWIDSLCIIQDSPKDWERESARMASVYANSLVTIAATKSASGDGGCFSFNPDTIIQGLTKDKLPYMTYARQKILHWYQPHTPLLGRGWVYQERLLSPRIVHFGNQELPRECMEETTCQCSGINDYAAGTLDRYEDVTISLAKIWHRMVREYSFLKLTRPSDKLTALSGLAAQMQSNRQAKYIAGLWEDTLLSDLLWFQLYALNPPHISRHPSWSWASVNGRIHF
ncbi:HET-domain-containing protein, partial [Glonium stellatum]